MEKAGINWCIDGHFVSKPDGSWHPTGDYRLLNAATVPDRYPLPNIRDFTAKLRGRCFFSKIDLVKGYYQVPMYFFIVMLLFGNTMSKSNYNNK